MKSARYIIPIVIFMTMTLHGADYRKMIIGTWELKEPRNPDVRLILDFSDGENVISRDFEPNGKKIHTLKYFYTLDGNRLILTEKMTGKTGTLEIILLNEKEFKYREGKAIIRFIRINNE